LPHARLLREFNLNPRKTLKNTLKNLLPQRLVDCFIGIAGVNSAKLVSQVTAGERQGLISLFKCLHLLVDFFLGR